MPMAEPEILPPLATADAPAPETEAGILRVVVRAYPDGGNQLEAAVRMALRLGWAARHYSGAI